MAQYRILSPATFGAGAILGLTEAQAAARDYALRALGEGRYQSLRPVQFKAGETIDFDGELDKPVAVLLERIEQEAAEREVRRGRKKASEDVTITAGDEAKLTGEE